MTFAPVRGLQLGVSLVVLAACVFAVLTPALGGDFLRWDDDVLILENRFLLEGSWAELAEMRILGNWHPLTLFSLALDHQIFGLDAAGFHLTSVLLHVANSLLVAVLLLQLFPGRLLYAVFCGALFGLHPLHAESAAWIGERKDVLSTFFYLLAMLAHLRYCDVSRARGASRGSSSSSLGTLALVWLLGGAALLAKAMAVSLPVALVLLDWYRGRRLDLRSWLEKAPLFAIAIGVSFVTLGAQAPPDPGNFAIYGMTLFERCWHAAGAIVFYASKTLVPERLSVYYDWELVTVELRHLAIVAAAFGALLWFAVRDRTARRDIAFGLAFWLVALAPVLKIVSFGFDSVFNDRYMYLPSVGFFLAFARPLLALDAVPRVAQVTPVARVTRVAVGLVLACLLGAFAAQSFVRAGVFASDERLWSDVLSKYPGTPAAHVQLGLHFENDVADLEAASHHYRLALASRPRYGKAQQQLARVLEKQQRYAEARRAYQEALRLDPMDAPLHVNAGAFLMRRSDRSGRSGRSDRDAAQPLFERAIELAPDLASAHHNLANVFLQRGQHASAKAEYERALELDSSLAGSYAGLAKIYEDEGDLESALVYKEAANRHGLANDKGLRRLRRAVQRARSAR